MATSGNRLLLSALAAALVLPAPGSTGVLIPFGAAWKYRPGTAEASTPADAWRESAFNDSTWPSGPASFGYGETSIVTAAPFAGMAGNYSTIFIRRMFAVADASAVTSLQLRADYDDGFILWINGVLVKAQFGPANPSYDAFASASHESGTPETFLDLADPSDFLVSGSNCAALMVFNAELGSSDCKIDVELSSVTKVADTRFSHDRGFYDAPFDVTITTDTAGAAIRYTTDGSLPTEGTGAVCSGPIRISTTTCLRAAAFKNGYVPTGVDTHTYIFLDHVLAQTRPSGYPTSWPTGTADYDVDPDVVNDSRYSALIKPAFKSIPTLSLVLDRDDMFGAEGIYYDQEETNKAPVSVELIYPPGQPFEGFQTDCALRGHSWDGTKRSFRLIFSAEYGPTKLRYPFFETDVLHSEGASESIDKLVLRAGANDSWTGSVTMDPASYTYTRDQWARDTALDMGRAAARGIFVHLYINGLYWGLYNPVERPDADWTSEYFGGEDADWYSHNHGGAVSGDGARYNYLQSYAAGNDLSEPARYQVVSGYVDAGEFSDYLVLAWADGNGDWPNNNWYFGNRNIPPRPGMYFTWDAEKTWYDFPGQNVHEGAWVCPPFLVTGTSQAIPKLWQNLWKSEEFRIEFADSIYRHCANSGALSDSRCRERWMALADYVEAAVICESARWGDMKDGTAAAAGYLKDGDGTYPLYTQDIWKDARDTIYDMMTGNAARMISACRGASWNSAAIYPAIDPPSFSQNGGAFPAGFALTMSAGAGTVYYTLDGSDPRAVGGAAAAGAATYSAAIPLIRTTHVRARLKNGSTWSALHACAFNYPPHYSRIRVTEIMYNPAGGRAYEFIEICNTGSSTRGLAEMRVKGIRYQFPPAATLGAGQYLVLAADAAAFQSRYGFAPYGEYPGSLDNGGEKLTIEDTDGAVVCSVDYDDGSGWPERTDGEGYSLVPIQPDGDLNSPANWRESNLSGGSPGQADGPSVLVFVNEALAHSDPPAVDWVEIANEGPAAVDIGGWYLSDDSGANGLKKYRIPQGTVVPAGGFAVFDESDFNADTNNPLSFSFSSLGDEAVLSSADAGGQLTGYRKAMDFGASWTGVSFGRHRRSDGRTDFTAMSCTSAGATNLAPKAGPVVFSEIMYHPAFGGDEFVELRNISASPVKLHDPVRPANTWRISGAADFGFPAGLELRPGERMLIVGMDPAMFRSKYAIPAETVVIGPYIGVLDNAGESLRLSMPDAPEGPAIPYVTVDRVEYDDKSPWPVNADGLGPSLERLEGLCYGNDPASWHASPASGGSPGRGDVAGDNDGDGMPDGWEIQYFGGTSASNGGPFADPDNDGHENLLEQLAGTHPLQASSVFAAVEVESASGDNVRISWNSVTGRTYRILRRNPPGWDFVTEVIGGIAATPPVNEQVVPLSGKRSGIFRIGIE